MRISKIIPVLFLGLSFSSWASSPPAPPPSCPSAEDIKSSIEGTLRWVDSDSNVFKGMYFAQFEGYFHQPIKSSLLIFNIKATGKTDAMEKLSKALPTLSGHPQAVVNPYGTYECHYDIGFGYKAGSVFLR